MPKVSVILPVRNAAPYLGASLSSILSQTFADYELLVMDDGSEDASLRVADEVAGRDPRVRIFERPPRGLVGTLNELIELADAPLIARMDADDIARPHRLQRQVEYLDGNAEVAVLGSWVQTFGCRSEVWHARQWDNFSRNLLFLGVTVLCHPSWMVRRELYDRHRYDAHYMHIEDREWLARVAAAERRVKFEAIPEILLDYRIHPGSVTGRFAAEQRRMTRQIVGRLLAAHGCVLSPEQLDDFMKVAFAEPCVPDEIERVGSVFQHASRTVGAAVPDEHFVFREYWLRFCAVNGVLHTLANRYLPTPELGFLRYRSVEQPD